MITKLSNVLRANYRDLGQPDPDGLKSMATISVRAHWFVSAVCLVELVYRPYYGVAKYAVYALLLLVLIGFTGYLHYRLRSNRAITWFWLQALYTTGVVLISVGVAISNGFSHPFFYMLYYPPLAAFALIFTTLRPAMVWVKLVAVVYVVISLTVGAGLDLEARDEKTLLARIAVMYSAVVAINGASRFERTRQELAVGGERALERERLEMTQTIHDTAAQSAYMIGLGIDRAKPLAGDSYPDLTAAFEETSRLSRSTIWEMRHPINMRGIYEGRALGRALRSHASSFTNVTAVPAKMTQTGVEPPLSIETRSLLFSLAHNAPTNAYRHAEASRVFVHLEFGEKDMSLSVSDDGTGLPDDYSERGSGFANMTSAAERLGRRLAVEERGGMGGATVTCVIPLERG